MAVNLTKGQRISLEKDGEQLTNLCVGVNWGAIEKKGFFGGKKKEAVDLDASCAVFTAAKEVLDLIYFGNLTSRGIQHSGDDLTGDMDGDDGLDNEIIAIDTNAVKSEADQIVFILNSFQGHDFKDIPFASIRIYQGTPTRVDSVLAKFDIAHDSKFVGSVSMVLGKMYKHNGAWKFTAIGEPTRDRKLEQTVTTVRQSYL